MNIQVDWTSSNLASAMLNSKIRPRAVVGYGVKIFHPSPPNYVTRSPGNEGLNFPTLTLKPQGFSRPNTEIKDLTKFKTTAKIQELFKIVGAITLLMPNFPSTILAGFKQNLTTVKFVKLQTYFAFDLF